MKPEVRDPFGLSQDQKKAAAAIKEWYNGKELIFTLYGAAGVGKTYLLKYLLSNILVGSSCITAPTHKALKVIEDLVGRKGKTLQSLHGLRPDVNLEDFDVNNITFNTIGADLIKNYKVVIIDECSQVGSSLYKLNEDRAKQYNVKILYIGDICQLPPIKERISKTFLTKNKYELTEVIRQSNKNPLLSVLHMLRKDILHGTNTFLPQLSKVPVNLNSNGEGYICLGKEEFSKEIVKTFKSRQFSENPQNFVRYAAYTNDNVGIWNDYIRKNTINDTEFIITKDDLTVGYKTIVDEFNTPILINSEDYVIEHIQPRVSDDGFDMFAVNFRSLLDNRSFTSFVVNHDTDNFKIFKDILAHLRFTAIKSTSLNRGKNWRKYFEYKDRYLTLKPIVITDDTGVETTIPRDLDYGYGLTIHKLQGSTVTHIFVNLIDICYYGGHKDSPRINTKNNPHAIEIRNKLLYTAISRAKKIAILLV